MEYINVNELLTGHTDLPVPETVEDAAPLSHSFQFFCWIANHGYVLGQFSFNLNVGCYISGRYSEYLLNECPKTKSRSNHNNQSKQRETKKPVYIKSTINSSTKPHAPVNSSYQVTFGLSLVSDWLIGWHRFLDWSERNKVKREKSSISFGNLLNYWINLSMTAKAPELSNSKAILRMSP